MSYFGASFVRAWISICAAVTHLAEAPLERHVDPAVDAARQAACATGNRGQAQHTRTRTIFVAAIVGRTS